MVERSRGHCSQRKTRRPSAAEGRCPSAVEGRCQLRRTMREVRRTKDEITKYKLRSTVAARLFASGIGASISHTCLAPLSFWRGAGGEAQCSSTMCKGHSRRSFPRLTDSPTAHDFNRGAQKIQSIFPFARLKPWACAGSAPNPLYQIIK